MQECKVVPHLLSMPCGNVQGSRKCCLANMMAEKQLTDAQIIDNVIAAAFGNASAGPTAAKALQYLATGDAAYSVMLVDLGKTVRLDMPELWQRGTLA